MGELRKDYILNEWVIIATERAKRPSDYIQKSIPTKTKQDKFAPGMEKYTPHETYVWPPTGKWQIRCFENMFPAVKPMGKSNVETHNAFYTFSDNFGYHEVLVETPSKTKQIWDLTEKELLQVLIGYKYRFEDLSKKPGISYVTIFKNQGQSAGTSILHSHSQIIAFNHVPRRVEDKTTAIKKHERCPYCTIIFSERDSIRKCFENEEFIAFCPYASRFPFELWIFPKQHSRSLLDLNLPELSKIMLKALNRLKTLKASFNYELYYSPFGADLHFHIEITPRFTIWAGFEQFGTIINPMPPEEAAKFYREK